MSTTDSITNTISRAVMEGPCVKISLIGHPVLLLGYGVVVIRR
jgi:hypothetical protein